MVARMRVSSHLVDAYQELPEGETKEPIRGNSKTKIREYNRSQLKMVRSQERPLDFGFARQQWFDTDEAFQKVINTRSHTVVSKLNQ